MKPGDARAAPVVDVLRKAAAEVPGFAEAQRDLQSIMEPMGKLQRARVVGIIFVFWGNVLAGLASWLDGDVLKFTSIVVFLVGLVVALGTDIDMRHRLDQWDRRWLETARLARRRAGVAA